MIDVEEQIRMHQIVVHVYISHGTTDFGEGLSSQWEENEAAREPTFFGPSPHGRIGHVVKSLKERFRIS